MRIVGLAAFSFLGVVACGQASLSNLVGSAPSTPASQTAPKTAAAAETPATAAAPSPAQTASQPSAPTAARANTQPASPPSNAPAPAPAPAHPAGPDPNEFVPTVAAAAPTPYAALPKTQADAQAKCDAGVLRACTILAEFLWYGRRGTTDATKGEALYRSTCAKGEPTACAGLANEILTQHGIDQHEARITNLEDWACKNGSGYGCWLRSKYDDAVADYKKECDGGYLGSCVSLGLLYAQGNQGVPQDDGQAAQLYQKACNGGDAEGCDWLGGRYEDGSGVPQNDSMAKAFYTKACNLKSSSGCDDLSKLVEDRRNRGIVIP